MRLVRLLLQVLKKTIHIVTESGRVGIFYGMHFRHDRINMGIFHNSSGVQMSGKL